MTDDGRDKHIVMHFDSAKESSIISSNLDMVDWEIQGSSEFITTHHFWIR